MINGKLISTTHFYIVWDIPLDELEMETAYEPAVKEDQPNTSDFMR